MPVCSIDAYRGADRLPVSGFPHLLRPHGWVYLRRAGRLGARVRAEGVAHVASRPCRGPDPTPDGDLGPGTVIHVDPTSWETVDIDLGPNASRMRSGIRYLRSSPDGGVTHLLAADAVPEGDWDD